MIHFLLIHNIHNIDTVNHFRNKILKFLVWGNFVHIRLVYDTELHAVDLSNIWIIEYIKFKELHINIRFFLLCLMLLYGFCFNNVDFRVACFICYMQFILWLGFFFWGGGLHLFVLGFFLFCCVIVVFVLHSMVTIKQIMDIPFKWRQIPNNVKPFSK